MHITRSINRVVWHQLSQVFDYPIQTTALFDTIIHQSKLSVYLLDTKNHDEYLTG
jgi:hypothetical protein